MNAVRAVVFDMGGVLVDLQTITHLFGDDSETEGTMWARWLASPSVRSYEMGECDLATFATHFVEEARLKCNATTFIERFRKWPNGLFAGAAQLVNTLNPGLTTAILSNTNALHWREQRDAIAITELFDRKYLSFELGLAKPDAAMFEHVIADLACDPSQIVFLDDNQINVDAAQRSGIQAFTVKGVAETRTVLTKLNLVCT